MIKINIKDIYVSNKIDKQNGVMYDISFFDKVYVNDFEERKNILNVTVLQGNDNNFEIISFDNFSKDEVLCAIKLANKSTYIVRHYDIYKKDIVKEDIVGLRTILNLNQSNNIIDIELKNNI